MITRALLIVLVLAATPAIFAQILSVGIKGGGSLLDPALRNDESKRYLIGPSLEVQLPGGFALEAEALYQRLGSSSNLNSSVLPGTSFLVGVQPGPGLFAVYNRQRGNSWEFPILGKYYFSRVSGWQPFAATGFSFRTIGIEAEGTSVLPSTIGSPQLTAFKSSFRSDLAVGAVIASGLQYKVGRVSLVPEIRYTRWGGNDSIAKKNAIAVFLGLKF